MNKLTEPRVGTIVQLKVRCLGNEAGVTGVCYNVYTIGDRKGYAFIFENGNYDGFAPDEVESFLLVLDHYDRFGYNFTHVIKLSRDFESGAFDEVFSEAQLIKRGLRIE